MSVIYVTNCSGQLLQDSFAGVSYEFPVAQTVEIPEEAAVHIFGYGDDNKEPYLSRLGWIHTRNEVESGLARLAKFKLSDQPPEKDQSLSPLVERVPLPAQKRAGGKILTVAA